ncbi:MAG: hypothetical protein GWM87_00800, partial [Xanthomonadales bacterium]|nr:hypothetical protein [Xanthomonadales bacterium]NIX11636.1 hypothetical protein [Xanthomonadales bacterium]
MRYLAKAIFTSMLFILSAGPAGAQEKEANDQAKPARLFESDAVMTVTLRGPWRRMTRNTSSDERFPGTLEYTDSSGARRTMDIGVTMRGLTRRDELCDFPPLKLWFDKDSNKGTEFRGQGSLKMVTYCDTNSRYEQFYIKEYYAYRIYNLITPYSFRVRPMTVTYLDTERDSDGITRFGFLIEDVDDMAERNGVKELEIPMISPRRLDGEVAALAAVFQYLIGNLDWSIISGRDPVECCH